MLPCEKISVAVLQNCYNFPNNCHLSMLFPKAPASCGKKIEIFFYIFCCIVILFMSSKAQKLLLKFLKIFLQTGDTNIFVLRGVFCSRYVQLKSSFSEDKTSAVKSETHLSRELCKLMWHSIKEKFHHLQRLELCKIVHNAKLR